MGRPRWLTYERAVEVTLAGLWGLCTVMAVRGSSWGLLHGVATIAVWEVGRLLARRWEGHKLTRRFGPGLPGMKLEDRRRVPYAWICRHDGCDARLASSDPTVAVRLAEDHEEREHAL